MLFSPEGDGNCANPCLCFYPVPTDAVGLGAERHGQEPAAGRTASGSIHAAPRP